MPGYEYVDSLTDKLSKTYIQHINTYKAFDAVLHKDNYLGYSWKKDGHFNSKGYRLFAFIIYTEINRRYPHVWNTRNKH